MTKNDAKRVSCIMSCLSIPELLTSVCEPLVWLSLRVSVNLDPLPVLLVGRPQGCGGVLVGDVFLGGGDFPFTNLSLPSHSQSAAEVLFLAKCFSDAETGAGKKGSYQSSTRARARSRKPSYG